MPRPPPKSPYQAYEGTQRSAQLLRQAEALAFARSAAALESAARAPIDRNRLEAVLKKNQLLWTMVQVECASAGNRLPPEVKGDLLTLGRFVDRQTVKAMISGAAADVDSLIAVNRDVAEGLMDGLRRLKNTR